MSTNLVPKSSIFFECKICYYSTSRFSQYERHLLTDKHKNQTFGNIWQPKSSDNICQCGKAYKDRSGLWKHKRCCKIKSSNPSTAEIVLELIKDNKEIKQILIQQCGSIQTQNNTINNFVNDVIKNGITQNNIQNSTNNSFNNTFNLNLFLNETCKDAMNITDFINSMNFNLEDLEHTGRKGYIEGISNIFLKNLNNLEQHMRPLHCSDFKREVLYIKDNNTWTKETEQKPILTKAIKLVANQNIKQIKHWKDKNPDCTNADSKKNNLYLKIVSNSMNGLTEEEGHKNINKIISNLAKEVVINKTNN